MSKTEKVNTIRALKKEKQLFDKAKRKYCYINNKEATQNDFLAFLVSFWLQTVSEEYPHDL